MFQMAEADGRTVVASQKASMLEDDHILPYSSY